MTETQQQPGTAVEKTRSTVALGGPVLDLDSAWRLAQNLAVADLMPRDLRNKPSDVLAVILYGQDLGLSAMQSIQGIDIIDGKPRISAQLMVAKAREAGHRVISKDHTDSSCTVEVIRKDTNERHEVTFTTDDAVKARLCTVKDGVPYARSMKGKPMPWETRHRTMLQWRAAQECLNFICPEIKFGFQLEGDYQVNDAGFVVTVEEDADDFAPPHEVEVQDAEIVDDETADAELAEMAARYDFTQPAETVQPERYPCEDCGPEANHFEGDCPKKADV